MTDFAWKLLIFYAAVTLCFTVAVIYALWRISEIARRAMEVASAKDLKQVAEFDYKKSVDKVNLEWLKDQQAQYSHREKETVDAAELTDDEKAGAVFRREIVHDTQGRQYHIDDLEVL